MEETIQATNATETVTRTAARFAAGDDALARLAREHHELTQRWRVLDQAILALSQAATQRNRSREKTLPASSKVYSVTLNSDVTLDVDDLVGDAADQFFETSSFRELAALLNRDLLDQEALLSG